MAFMDHIRSGLTGVGVTGALAVLGGAGCWVLGAMGAGAGLAALAAPMMIGGACVWGGGAVCALLIGRQQGGQTKTLSFLLGIGITSYCMLANFGPTKDSVPYRNEIFHPGKTGISQKFHKVARKVNEHIIWPDFGNKPVQQHKAGPGYP